MLYDKENTEKTEKLEAEAGKKYFWADLVRAIAVISVVIIHIADISVRKWQQIPDSWWHASNIYGSCTRMAVPLFVILSGALLLGRQESYKDFFKKRVFKILLLIVVWSIVYYGYRIFLLGHDIPLWDAFIVILRGNAYFHLWYFYMIFGLYLLTPLFRIMVQNASQKDLIYLFCIWIFTVPLGGPLHMYLDISFGFHLGNAGGYLGYFIFGYMIVNSKISGRFFLIALALMCIAAFATAYGTFSVVAAKGEYNETYYQYLSWNVSVLALSSFVVLKYLGDNFYRYVPKFIVKIISLVSATSLGIYAFHVIPLELIKKGSLGFKLDPTLTNSAYTIPLMALAVLVVSFVVSYILGKIPYVRKIV